MSAPVDRFVALDCPRCSFETDPTLTPSGCPECGAMLEPRLDLDSLTLTPTNLATRPFASMWRYEALLPFDHSSAVTLDEGATPLVSTPNLAEEVGVGELHLKLEGNNPTGTFKDRGQTVAISAAKAAGASDVALASAGNAGHAAAAYAARGGLDAHVFLPARASFTTKAMVNVHGGDLTVISGNLNDTGRAFRDALEENGDWVSVATADTPFRREGKKTMFYEIAEQLGWSVPDAIVYPTGGGVGLLGMAKAARELESLGWIDSSPSFIAAQSTGCQPIVEAYEAGEREITPVDRPDTICGGIEVPSPSAGAEILDVIDRTDGSAVASDDDAILDAALTVAAEAGIGIAPTAAAAVSGVERLVETGSLTADDHVVVVATGTALKEPDVLRSQLMSHGV